MTATLDARAFEALRERMAALVRDDGVGGLAWAVSVGGEVVDGAAGWRDPDRRERPMTTDAIFRIASVSKPIVAVAALQLVAQGRIGLDDPIDAVLPELAGRRVLVDPTGPLDQATVPADRALTLRDLLTFRCGLGMDFDFTTPQPVLDAMWAAGVGPGPTAPACEPDEFLARLGALPLIEQPGTRWRYHTGSDIASVLIERLRGEPLDVVLARDVCTPCGMSDTTFWVDTARRDRFGACRMWNDDGALAVWDEPDGRWSSPPPFRSGATGLVSTVADLVAFGRMLLAGGVGPSGRVLDAASVRELTTDQLTDRQRALARIDDHGDAQGWGLGVGVQHRAAPGGWPGAGAYGWDGGLGSRWLVDPAHDLCAVLLTTDAFATSGAPVALATFVDAIATIIGDIHDRRTSVNDTADRFRRVADGLTRTVDAVPPDAWSNPSPCAGWVARDVVDHLVTWLPGPGFLLGAFGIDTTPIPSVDDDPAGAWAVVRDAIQGGLDDPVVAARVADCGPAGTMSFEAAVAMTCIPDVLVHTWDLATATGVDPVLDADEVASQAAGVAQIPPMVDEAMRGSGHFGPRVEVSADADALTRLLAFYGRRTER